MKYVAVRQTYKHMHIQTQILYNIKVCVHLSTVGPNNLIKYISDIIDPH